MNDQTIVENVVHRRSVVERSVCEGLLKKVKIDGFINGFNTAAVVVLVLFILFLVQRYTL